MSGIAALAILGGDIAVDFANTMSWHASDGERREYLSDFGEVLKWAVKLSVISEDEAATFARGAVQHPIRASRAHERAVQLRETVYRVLTACSHDAAPESADVLALHRAAVEAESAATPEWRDNQLTLTWPMKAEFDFDRPIHPVMIAARELLMSDRMKRLGQCDNHPCGWLFIDTSRNGMRRWCSSEECGNQARVRKFRSKA